MKLTVATSSVSRAAGGLFDAMRRPAQFLATQFRMDVQVVGVKDRYTDMDRSSWNPIVPTPHTVRGPKAFGFAPDFTDAIETFNPEILHTHGLWMYLSIVVYGQHKKNKKPYIISPHGMLAPFALRISRSRKLAAKYMYENRHLKNAQCLHAFNNYEMQCMRNYGLKNPVCLIPNGVDIDEDFRPSEPRWAIDINKDRKVLLYLGRLHPIKGLPNLIEAWNKLNRENPNHGWTLAIAGWDQGGHRELLRKMVAEKELCGSVIFVGPQYGTDKHNTYSKANAFILPSFVEAFPMVVLEAWSHRLPVLMTNSGLIPGGIENGAAIGMLPEPESIHLGLQKITRMSDDERTSMGLNGFRLVKERYTWSRVADDLYDVYQWILGGGAAHLT